MHRVIFLLSFVPKTTIHFKMGQSISDVRKEAKAATEQQKQEFQERLQILEKLIHQRLDNEKNNILNGEKHDQEIDTGTIVSLHK